MSFTDEVKHELTRIGSLGEVELAALIRMDGTIRITNQQLAVKVSISQGDLARKVYSLLKKKYNLELEIVVRRYSHFSNYQNIYELIIPPQPGIRGFLTRLGFLDKEKGLVFRVNQKFVQDRESKRAYLRGAFLGGGSVNNPNSEYHLELRCEHESLAEDLVDLLFDFDLEAHLTYHRHKYIVYFKSFEEIVTVLNIIGAHQALLLMENRRLFKDLKNDVNRRVNFETANLDKTVRAAMHQLEDIDLVESVKGLEALPDSLKEIARLRKQNPYASFKELGELLDPPLSKSGVNHRMRRIRKLAERLRRGS